MKRSIILIWSILIFMLIIGIAQAEGIHAEMYAVSEQHIWLYNAERINVVSLDGKLESSFDCHMPDHIAATETSLIYNTGSSIFECDVSGNLLNAWEISKDLSIWQLEANDTYIYFLASEAGAVHNLDCSYMLYRLNRMDGRVIQFSDSQYSMISISKNQLYALASGTLYSMDVYDHSGNLKSVLNLGQIHFFAVDPEEKYIVGYNSYLSPTPMRRIQLEEGEETLVMSIFGSCAGMRANSTGIYIKNQTNNEIMSLAWDEFISEEVTEKLTIVNSWDTERFAKTVEMFKERYPQIEIVRVENGNENLLMADIMAGEGNADIVFVQVGGGADPRIMAKAGAVVNLAEYDEFMANLAQWYDVSGLVGTDDYVYGVIERPHPYVWNYNSSILSEIGCEVPQDGWTWNEFFELGRKLDAYNKANNKQYKLLIDSNTPYLILQYHNNTMNLLEGTASYDNETFRSLISQWKEIEQMDLIATKGSGVFSVNSTSYASLLENKYVLPPVYDESTRWPVYTITGVVNANCKNIEAAAYFMTCFISPEALTSGYFASWGKLIADDSLYPEGSLEPDSFRHTPTAENAAYWQRMIENGVAELMYNDVLRTFVKELYPQYLNDEIDLDIMLRMLQQRADMMLGE